MLSPLAMVARRFAFGENWETFVASAFTPERRLAAKARLLEFLEIGSLDGLTFLDIGSGSGLHSLAAHDSGAARIHSFDYDPQSACATQRLHETAGGPDTWTVERGDVLDEDYMSALGLFDIVYAWGVLHHTGAMWRAIEASAKRVAPGGLFFVALYSSNVASPSTDFWLDVKQRYNAAGTWGKRRMELWYLWRFGIDRRPWRMPALVKQIIDKKRQRGMSYMTDVRDWLGGWPMEYAADEDVIAFMRDRGFSLRKIKTGEACTEFLFVALV